MANLPTNNLGSFIAIVQKELNDLTRAYNQSFNANGGLDARANIEMNGYSINDANIINVDTLRYTTLDPPVSSGGNVTGPGSSTNNAIARYDGITGQLVKNSSVTISDDAKIAAAAGTIDMSTAGSLNFISASVNVNGTSVTTGTATPVIDSDIPVWNGVTGHSLKSSGVSISALTIGAAGATDNAIARYDGITGTVIQNSAVTISDDAKIAGTGGSIDLSTAGVLDLISASVRANGSAVVSAATLTTYVQGPASAVDDNIATYNLTTGKLIKDSGVAIGQIANKLPLAGGTMLGSINMGTNSVTNATNIAGTVKTSAVNDIVTSSAGTAVDSDIAVFDSTTGKIIKNSSIQVSTIAGKLSLDGGTMAGSINMGGFGITNASLIAGTIKSNPINDIVTSASGVVVDSNIPIWNSTTGRVLKDSGIAIASLTVGAASSTDNAVARFDGVTGTLIQNSAITISDDAKIAATGGTIDMSTAGVINFIVGGFAQVNGSSIATATTLASYVAGPASAVDDNIATYNLTTGKLIKDSGVAIGQIANKLPLAGGTMLGSIAMGTNNLTNVGTISGATYSRTADNIVSNTGAGVANNIPVFSGATGKVITDSGVAISAVSSPSASITGLNSQVANIASRGSSDTWTNVNPANSQALIVYASSLTRMISYATLNNISYSNDNGTTWSLGSGLAVTTYIAGWSGTVFAALGVGILNAYTSADGITWSAQAAPPYQPVTDTCRMEFISGLFMIGTSNGTNGIQTSPDGITWTARAATRAPYRFASSGTVIAGASPSGFIYSSDGGITWVNTVDTFNCRSITYSSARKEFIAGSASTTTSYRSVDGITWTAYAATMPVAINTIFWEATTARYYLAARDPTSLFYSLYSSVDGITAFVNISSMSGASAVGTIFYDTFYLSSANRFYIISNTAPRIHYSTISTTLVTKAGLLAAGPIVTSDTTASSSTATGSGVFAGGLGVAGAINAGGVITTTDATASSSTTTGSIITAGGLGVAGSAYVAKLFIGPNARPAMSGGFTMITNTTVSNTTTETTIIGAGIGSLTGLANTIPVGATTRSTVNGNITINGSPTLTFRVYGGATSTTLLATFAITLATLAAGSAWRLETCSVVKTIGAATTASVQFNSTFHVNDSTSVNTYGNQTLNNTTFDTTVNNVLNITAQWSAAHASNILNTNQLFTNSVYVV